MSKVIAYARVSTVDQNLERQLEAFKQYNPYKVFTDKATGKNDKREGLQQLKDYVRSGDTVIVSSLDRLGRSTINILSLVQDWADQGIGLQILDNKALSFSADGKLEPAQKLMLSVMASVAELERSLMIERQRQGIALAKERGAYTGRKKQVTVSKDQALAALSEHDGNKSRAAESLGVNRTTFYRLIA